MRFIGILFELALILGVCYGVYQLLFARSTRKPVAGRPERAQVAADGPATWQVRHYGDGADRVVAVSLVSDRGRVLDEHVVDRIPDGDPDWEARFLRARQTAEERAFHLGSGSS